MKEYLKTILSTLPIYIIIFILFWDKDNLSKKELIEQLNQRDSIISQKINDKGERVITHTNREYHPYIIKSSNDQQFVDLRDELKDMNIKIRDLKSAIKLNTRAIGEGQAKIVKSDSLDKYEFSDSTSKHLMLSGSFDLNKKLLNYQYDYQATYGIYSYDYKNRLFKRPELRLNIKSDDPNNNISAQTFTIKQPRDWFSVGAGVGGSLVYDNGNIKVLPAIQVGVYIPFYTFKSKK